MFESTRYSLYMVFALHGIQSILIFIYTVFTLHGLSSTLHSIYTIYHLHWFWIYNFDFNLNNVFQSTTLISISIVFFGVLVTCTDLTIFLRIQGVFCKVTFFHNFFLFFWQKLHKIDYFLNFGRIWQNLMIFQILAKNDDCSKLI